MTERRAGEGGSPDRRRTVTKGRGGRQKQRDEAAVQRNGGERRGKEQRYGEREAGERAN